jgi:hypothetical protein
MSGQFVPSGRLPQGERAPSMHLIRGFVGHKNSSVYGLILTNSIEQSPP